MKTLPYPGLCPQSPFGRGLAELVAFFDIVEEGADFSLTATQRPPFGTVFMEFTQGGPDFF